MHFCRKKANNSLFKNESQSKITFKRQDFYSATAFRNLKTAFNSIGAIIWPISGRVDRASATEAVDSGLIPGRVKTKTIKIGIHSFSAWCSAIRGTVWSLRRVG